MALEARGVIVKVEVIFPIPEVCGWTGQSSVVVIPFSGFDISETTIQSWMPSKPSMTFPGSAPMISRVLP